VPRNPLIESSPAPISEEVEQQIYHALFSRQKISAIKIHREETGAGLKDSKEFIDILERQLRNESPERFVATKGIGCTGVMVLSIGAVLAAMTLL
jgi:catalase